MDPNAIPRVDMRWTPAARSTQRDLTQVSGEGDETARMVMGQVQRWSKDRQHWRHYVNGTAVRLSYTYHSF